MIKRHILNKILEALSDTPVVLLSGARQTGKSTLAKWLAEDPAGRIVGIEIKAAATLTGRDFAALKDFSGSMGDAFHRGIILYTGSEPVSFGKNLHAQPVSTLWK